MEEVVDRLATTLLSHTVPIQFEWISSGGTEIRNGSTFLVRQADKYLGITCEHVIDEYLSIKAEHEDAVCVIGGQPIDLIEMTIDTSSRKDLAIIDLDAFGEFPDIGLGQPSYYGMDDPFASVAATDVLIYGGFPGQWRVVSGVRQLEYSTFSLAGELAQDIRDCSFKISIEPESYRRTDLGFRTLNDLVGYGGLSGAPVFAIRGDTSIDPVGIIREGGDLFLVASRLDAISRDWRL